MAESNYKPNSHKSKEASKEARTSKAPVVKTAAQTKKRSGLSKIADNFVAEDASSVGSFIVTDVIIPKAKDLLSAIIKQSVDMFLFGSSRPDSNTNRITPYNKYYTTQPLRGSYEAQPARSRIGLDYEDPVLASYGDAEAVLSMMYEYADESGVVSIMDMYDLAGIKSDNYMLCHYGWTRLSLRSAKIDRISDGRYIVRTPRAVSID